MVSTQDRKINHTKKTIIYSFLEETNQNMAIYPAQMTGLNMLEMIFMKVINADDPSDDSSCIPGTTFKSTLYNAVSEVILITNPIRKRTVEAIASMGLFL